MYMQTLIEVQKVVNVVVVYKELISKGVIMVRIESFLDFSKYLILSLYSSIVLF